MLNYVQKNTTCGIVFGGRLTTVKHTIQMEVTLSANESR